MLKTINQTPLAVAVGACMLFSAVTPAHANLDMMRRMEILEKELDSLKSQMAQKEVSQVVRNAKPSDDGVRFGGYIKMDVRHVNGDIGYQDYWLGINQPLEDSGTTKFSARETRLNASYKQGDFTGYVEMDFYGGDGNQLATNGFNPRLRHAFIRYGNWLVGQYWSTFTPTMAFPEALDFAGAINAEVFVRQPQVRYTRGNFAIALENPETYGDGDIGASVNGFGHHANYVDVDPDEDTPDLIATYRFAGDWGEVQIGGLVRKVDQGGLDETSFAYNVGGKIKVGEQDDLRFQFNGGESGRYVGALAAVTSLVDTDGDGNADDVEETTAFTAAYRHFWNNDWRSTAYYGWSDTDVNEREITQWGINLIRQLGPNLTVGVEVGNYGIDVGGGPTDAGTDADSDYIQASWKLTL